MNSHYVPRASVNYALAATLLSQGLSYDQAAPQCGAKSGAVLKNGLLRRGVTMTATRRGDFAIQRATAVATKVVSQASEALRADLASILAKHVGSLSEIPAKPNLKHIKAVGDAMEPLTRTAKIVHDWGSEQPNALVVAGLFTEPAPQAQIEQATDIQAVVSSEPVVGQDKNPSSNPSQVVVTG